METCAQLRAKLNLQWQYNATCVEEGEGLKSRRGCPHKMLCTATLETVLSNLFLSLINLLSTWDSGFGKAWDYRVCDVSQCCLILWCLGVLNSKCEWNSHQLHLKQRTVTEIWRSVMRKSRGKEDSEDSALVTIALLRKQSEGQPKNESVGGGFFWCCLGLASLPLFKPMGWNKACVRAT